MRTYLRYIHTYYFPALMLLGFSACKEQKILTPDFDVTVAKTTYAPKEAITFTVTGDADIVSFFSGATELTDYKYKDRFRVDGKPQMEFTSYRQGTSTQTGSLSLLVSKDFSGTYDVDNLNKATWTDITSRATLSTGTDNTPSGVIDLSDLQTADVPVYIAFKYAAKKDATTAQPTWTVKNIAVTNKTTDGKSYDIAKSSGTTGVGGTDINWSSLNVLNSANIWSSTTAQIQITGGAINADDNEDWIVTKPIALDRVARARGVSIKPSPTTKLTKYVYAYAAPGTYTATFEATNANKWDNKKTVKEFTFTVQ